MRSETDIKTYLLTVRRENKTLEKIATFSKLHAEQLRSRLFDKYDQSLDVTITLEKILFVIDTQDFG